MAYKGRVVQSAAGVGQAEQHLVAIVVNSDDAIVSMSLDGVILSWNNAATRIYGYTAEEAVGQPIDIIIADTDEGRVEEADIRAQIARGERIDHFETIHRHRSGHIINVSLSVSPVRDGGGRIVAAAGIARDITEQKLLQAEQHLAAIVDSSDDAIVSESLRGTILSWNAAATRMYGYTAEEAVGQPIDIVIPDDPERVTEELSIREKIAHGERIEHYETVRRHRSGRHIDVSLSISPVRDANGKIVAAAGIARDITDLNRAYQFSQHLAAIVDNSDDAIVSESLGGTILSWNAAATRMYGYTAEEAIGQPIDIVIPDDPERLAEELSIREKIAHGERIDHFETIRRHRSGALIEVSLSMSPVRDSAGRIVSAAGFARDISERKLFLAAQRLAAIVDNSDDAIVSKTLDGMILTWNDAATRMYGYTAEEAVGRPIDIIIPDTAERRAEEADIRVKIAQGQRIDHAQTIRRRKSGEPLEVSLSISPVRDTTGRIVAAAGIARDITDLNRAYQSSQHMVAIVDSSDDAIVSKTLDGIILTWNDAATRMYGYTAEEAVGQPIDIVIPPDDPERVAEEAGIRAKIAQGERIDHIETIRRHRSGGDIDVSLSISPVRDASGRIIAAAGIARDITDLNRAYQSSQHLAAIVDNSDDAIVSKSLGGTILSWNAAATRMYGYTAEEAIGQPIDIVIPDDRLAEEADIRAKIAQGERIDHFETIRRHRSGELIEVSLTMSPVRDSTDKIVSAAGFARDISERKLFLANQRLAAIIDNSDDAIVSRDLDGLILTWNAAATRMYGYTVEEAVGQPIGIVIPDTDESRAEEADIRAKIAQGERIDHAETIRRRKNGELVKVSLSISPVRDTTGRIVAAASIARDISERKRLEEEQRRATDLLERFIDYTAHDFKTPMQNILMNAQEASRLVTDAQKHRVRELLQRIVANSVWMNKRTEGLLRTSTLKGNRQIRSTVRADKAFDESYAILKSVDRFVNDAKVHRGDLPAVASDEALLGFLFQNLLQNACKYGRIGEEVVVHVTADRYGAGWKFAVRDNGMGIKPHLLERIFEPYVRDPEVGGVPGTGIGLHFCRTIAEWHGGRIWAESGAGEGATFWFTIPDFAGGTQ